MSAVTVVQNEHERFVAGVEVVVCSEQDKNYVCSRWTQRMSRTGKVSVGVTGCPGVSVGVTGCPGVSVDVTGCPGVSVGVTGCPGVSVGVTGCPVFLLV